MKDLKDRKFRTKEHKWPARIVNDDRKHPTHPVTAFLTRLDGVEIIESYTEGLKYFSGGQDDVRDLEEVFPWSDFTQDAPVVCWDGPKNLDPNMQFKYHFAEVSPEGKPLVYPRGQTSHTHDGGPLVEWDNCVSLEEYQLMQECQMTLQLL